MAVGHQLFSTAILTVALIKGGQLSVSGERISTSTFAKRTKPAQAKSDSINCLPRNDLKVDMAVKLQ